MRAGSAAGQILYENTVRRGASVNLTAPRPLWMRVGAGTNLDAWVDGKALRGIPYMTGNLLLKA